jgi:hypothetical protein
MRDESESSDPLHACINEAKAVLEKVIAVADVKLYWMVTMVKPGLGLV